MEQKALLITPELCIGCRACQAACKQWNSLSAVQTVNRGTYENPEDLSANLHNRIRFIETPSPSGIRWIFSSQRCMHCTEAGCLKSCPVPGVIYKTDEGFILYDREKCTGNFKTDKRECAQGCPYKVVRFDLEGKITKCHFCYERITNNLEPACAKTCPTKSIQYGNRKELIGSARKNGFSKIYGETELGGLHVLFALNESPSVYKLLEEPVIGVVTSLFYQSLFSWRAQKT